MKQKTKFYFEFEKINDLAFYKELVGIGNYLYAQALLKNIKVISSGIDKFDDKSEPILKLVKG